MTFTERLKELMGRTTPGPWRVVLVYSHIKTASGEYVAEPIDRKMQFRHVPDSELIVYLHNHAPALLKCVEALNEIASCNEGPEVNSSKIARAALRELDGAGR